MPRFAYSAYTASGALERGEVQAPSDVAALDQLSVRGLTPVSLTARGHALPWWQRDLTLGGATKAKPEALEMFFKTLAGLLQVRLPLPQALRFCSDQATDRTMARMLGRVLDEVNDGRGLAQSMQAADGYFPARLVTMVEIGEASNRLDTVCARIATTLGTEASQRRELRSALVYPLILVLMSVLVLALLVFFLAPTLAPVFASADADLPLILSAMIALRDTILSGWPVLLAAALCVLVLMRVLHGPLGRISGRLALRLPVLGRYLRQAETLKMLQTLALMLSSGAHLPRAIATARQTARHPAYRVLLADTEEQIVAGGTLSASLAQSPLIDPMAAMMLQAGEETDRMGPVLDQVVTDLRDRTGRTMAQAIRLITPLLTLAIGLGVGGVILSTVSAIMSLNDVAF